MKSRYIEFFKEVLTEIARGLEDGNADLDAIANDLKALSDAMTDTAVFIRDGGDLERWGDGDRVYIPKNHLAGKACWPRLRRDYVSDPPYKDQNAARTRAGGREGGSNG